MRHAIVLTSIIAVIAICAGPATAQWVTADGDLTEWGLDPSNTGGLNWLSDVNGVAFELDDDTTHRDYWSGGEWYDIEAIYLSLDWNSDGQYIHWAMVTSYGGVDIPSNASPRPALPSGVSSVADLRDYYYRDGSGLHYLDYPYRRHPVLALRFNSEVNWTHGIIMAPNYDYDRYDDTGHVYNPASTFVGSYGLKDPHPDYSGNPDAEGAKDNIHDAPQLWAVSTWRDAHPNEFGQGTYHPSHDHPVDFDVTNPSNVLLTTGDVWGGAMSSSLQGSAYPHDYCNESPQVGGSGAPWPQADNFVWEGWVPFPTTGESADYGVDFDRHTTVSFHYAMYCGNNNTFGDSIVYGAPDGDDSPELGTWALLACTGAFGGLLRRRRSKD